MKILIVDDDSAMIDALTANLKIMGGHEVLTAFSGETAVPILKTHPDIDLCITDMDMQDMDGLMLLAEMNKMDHQAERWLMSGRMDQEMMSIALDIGAEEGLLKSDVPEKLKEKGLIPPR